MAKILKVRNQLNIGFLKIISDLPLTVTAVYTISDMENKPASIAVEQIMEQRMEYLEELPKNKK
jgi:hypothetical protein